MSVFNDIRTAFSRRDNALNQLLLLNVAVFVVVKLMQGILFLATGARDGEMLLLEWLAVPSTPAMLLTRPWTVLTYAFVHEGFLHIIFNLLNLYWFGILIREYLGDRKLVSLYVLGALGGALVYLLAFNLLPVFRGHDAILYGASASVMAVVIGAATLLPDFTFSLILIGPVKIKYIAAALLLISVAALSGDNSGGQLAHFGGALMGFVFVRQLQKGRDLGRPIQAVGDWVGALFSGRPRLRVSHRSRPAAPAAALRKNGGPQQPEPSEIDNILDKISRSGYESLSKDEKQKLFRASQQ